MFKIFHPRMLQYFSSVNNNDVILDVGCGKAFILYEIKKILPNIKVIGFDISKHAIKNAPRKIKNNLFIYKAQKKYPYKKNSLYLYNKTCQNMPKMFPTDIKN